MVRRYVPARSLGLPVLKHLYERISPQRLTRFPHQQCTFRHHERLAGKPRRRLRFCVRDPVLKVCDGISGPLVRLMPLCYFRAWRYPISSQHAGENSTMSKNRNSQLNPCRWRERELSRDRLKGSRCGSPLSRDAIVFMGASFVALVALIAVAEWMGPTTPTL